MTEIQSRVSGCPQNALLEGEPLTRYVINGGRPLYGEVEISGAKNAAVAIIPAALLISGTCRIENVPRSRIRC
jgi:UDP-N-acetylglucosamine 1-carboxyvinyltransferase